MHIDEGKSAVVLKLSISLETPAGERLISVQTNQVFRDVLNAHVPGRAEAALQELLDTQVIVPCRALIRAHVNRIQEEASFTCLDSKDSWRDWIDGRVSAALMARLDTIAAEARDAQ